MEKEKLPLRQVLKAHNAGGVLSGGYPGKSTAETWDTWTRENFDMSDPSLVELLQEWKMYIDASIRFNLIIESKMIQMGIDYPAP